MRLRFCAIVVAAGRGVRFGGSKQTIELAGRPLVAWSLAEFADMPELEDLVIATEPEHLERLAQIAAQYASRLVTIVVQGGVTRQASVARALAAVPRRCDGVFVHDGARPLVRAADVRAGMNEVAPGVGALLATPVVDTIKVVAPGTNFVLRTLQRDELWAAQTPQFATVADLRRAHDTATREGIEATDDVALLERIGARVTVVPATGENFKVTLPGDRERAAALLVSAARR